MVFEKERTASNLRAIRNLRGKTQEQLAKESGVSLQSLKGYEQAENIMSLEAATRLSRALDCSIDSLVNELAI